MKIKMFLPFLAALLAPLAADAQLNPQPLQPQTTLQAQTDCTPRTPKPPSDQGNQFRFHLPKSVQQIFDNGRKKIENTAGIQAPPITPKAVTKPAVKPCTPVPATPATNPQP